MASVRGAGCGAACNTNGRIISSGERVSREERNAMHPVKAEIGARGQSIREIAREAG